MNPAADLLRWPVVGPFLRWRHARTSAQLVLLAAAAVVVVHGLFGPQLAPTNLATVLTWVHYRGLLVVGLLAAGNLFCTGCPFVKVRDVGRRLHTARRRWPRWLRTKWIGVALFVAVLFAYELFDLWALPRATAWLVLGYFAGALAVDLVFSGATFCKYLCPIGQFNFAASTMSPLEVHVRDFDRCRSCRTVDCIKGRRTPEAPGAIVQRGCELGLFLPVKVGNLDCTFCLDCVQACPHDNIGIMARLPGAELSDARRRSGIGRIARRPDIAALTIVFVFGALLNAFGMVQPVYAVEQWIAGMLGMQSEAPALLVVFLVALGVLPAATLGAAALATRWATGEAATPLSRTIVTYVHALLPLGFGIWLAHYSFHLLTGMLTIIPVVQSAAADLAGRAVLGDPEWRWTGLRPGVVFPIQLGLIVLGSMGSLAVAYQLAERESPKRALAAAVPWVIVVVGLAAFAVWILGQPMEMRAAGFAG